MSRPSIIQPKWVLVDGVLRDVSDFASIVPGKRPDAVCPLCRHRVTLKMGKVVAHHYAHRPDPSVVCTASRPETALHLNTKFHLYRELREAERLYVVKHCIRCGVPRRAVWCEGWDDVQVEYTVSEVRPDIALLRHGQVVGALEVVVRNPLNGRKQDILDERGVPWLEVHASERLYDGDDPWTPIKGLPFSRISPAPSPWVCPECQAKGETDTSDSRDYEARLATKLVDLYYPSGKKFRESFTVMKRVRNGECVEVWVKSRDNHVLALVQSTDLNPELALARVQAAVADHLERRRKAGVIVDDFLGWRPWAPGMMGLAKDFHRYPFRHTWDAEHRQWTRHMGRSPL